MFGSLVQSWIGRRRILCSVELWIVRQMLSCESECWHWMDPDEPNPVSWVPVCSHCSKGGFILLRTCSKGDEYCCNTPNTKRNTDQWQQQPHLAQTLVQKGQRWNCCLDWRIVKRSSGSLYPCGWFWDLVEIYSIQYSSSRCIFGAQLSR